MVIYEAYVNGLTVSIGRLELTTKGRVVRALNHAADAESIDSSYENLGFLTGHLYRGTKKEIIAAIRETFGYCGISMRRVTINWQQEEA